MWIDQLAELTSPAALLTAVGVVGAVIVSCLAVAARRRTEAGTILRRLLIGLAITAAIGVAIVGGVRSFEAVSVRFGSPLVPLTADGMIVACTALRIAALTRGWRIPGALATTYLFICGTVWLNVAAAHDWSDAIAHALAPMSYAILVEMLAHLLRLLLHLATPPRRRVAALAWATSPVVTTRVWLHFARTDTDDPVEARALVQQLLRLSSRLRMVCPRGRPWPFGRARRARAAALQTVRDGLLTAHRLAELLPTDDRRLTPAVLLARVDQAALRSSGAPATPGPSAPEAPAPGTPRTPPAATPETEVPDAPATTTTPAAPNRYRGAGGNGSGPRQPTAGKPAGGAADWSDAELVTELHRIGGPMSGRKVMRVLGVGWPRAKRLVDLAGWSASTAQPRSSNGNRANGSQSAVREMAQPAETTPAVHFDLRKTP
ncbi:MAG: DUF2637 domain-containing protein [Kribbellaceae bacterium]